MEAEEGEKKASAEENDSALDSPAEDSDSRTSSDDGGSAAGGGKRQSDCKAVGGDGIKRRCKRDTGDSGFSPTESEGNNNNLCNQNPLCRSSTDDPEEKMEVSSPVCSAENGDPLEDLVADSPDDAVWQDREGSSGETEEGVEGNEASDSDSDDDEEKWRLPRYRWNLLRATRKRELGLRSGESPHWFRYKAMGSRHMVERMELMYKMTNHHGCINTLHFNESGTRLASGSDDLHVTIWDWAVDQPLLKFNSGHSLNVFQAKFMPLSGDCHIITCARDGEVRLAELSVRGVCKSTRLLASHRGSAHKLALKPESPHVFLTSGEDGVVFEIDLRDPTPNKILTCKSERNDRKVALYSIHSNPRNTHEFAVSGRDAYCRVFDLRSTRDSQPLKKYCPHHLVDAEWMPNVTCVVYNYNGSELLATYNDDDIYSFDTSHSDGADYIRRYTGHRNNATVKGVNWYGASSEFVVSGSDCGNVYFWDRDSEKMVHFVAADEAGVVNCLEPHPTTPILATSGLDHDVKVWVPSCEDPKFDLPTLKKLTKKNLRLREDDRNMEDPVTEEDMRRFMFAHLRTLARLRRQQAEGGSSSSEDGDEDQEGVRFQCRPS